MLHGYDLPYIGEKQCIGKADTRPAGTSLRRFAAPLTGPKSLTEEGTGSEDYMISKSSGTFTKVMICKASFA